MPRPCGECGEVGHARKNCPLKRRCGYCKRDGGGHAVNCRRNPKTAASPVARPRSTTSAPDMAGARQLLRQQLEEERADLQAQLAVVDRMLAKITG